MDKEEIIHTIKTYISKLVGIPVGKIAIDVPLERYGLDSTAAAGLSGELSERLNIKLNENMAFQHPTVSSMADYIAGIMENSK